MGSIAKAIAAFFTTLGTWGATALADGRVSGPEWFGLCGVVVATAAVWEVTNTVPVPAAKTAKKAARSSKGQISVGEVLFVVVVVLLVLLLLGYPNR